jgi:ERF superfamily
VKSSEEINEIAAALAKAQSSITNPGKDSENPAFKNGGRVSRYAGLADALTMLRKELSAVSIAVLQAPRIEGDAQVLDTRLVHSSGQWVGCEWPIGRLGMKQQELGSATTYARRYSLFSLVGISGSDDDDDGSAASGTSPTRPMSPNEPVRTIDKTDEQVIESALLLLPPETRDTVLKRARVAKISDIPLATAGKVKDFLNGELGKLPKKMAAE